MKHLKDFLGFVVSSAALAVLLWFAACSIADCANAKRRQSEMDMLATKILYSQFPDLECLNPKATMLSHGDWGYQMDVRCDFDSGHAWQHYSILYGTSTDSVTVTPSDTVRH